jgi:alpha-2-macroglobulin
MAPRAEQSQLHRHISSGLLVALLALGLTAWDLPSGRVVREATAAEGYEPFKGQPFFLLSDSTFGSDAMALVRIEAPGREDGYLQRYSGIDILVYRVPEPLAFLKRQKDLHRIEVKGQRIGEGLANTLRYVWDSLNRNARYAWGRLFSSEARKTVTAQAPELKRHPAMGKPTVFEHNPQFEPLRGFDLIDRFRYPLWEAKPIEPPRDVRLAGSSSEFIHVSEGNVMVPIGRQKPGLYLVEAIIGSYRANTLVFVSDTVALVKNASDQLLVWTAHRDTGRAVAGVNVVWTDGLGTLQSGRSGSDGTAVFSHSSPEHTYVVGEDAAGGVFVSENFYYDSEIYNAKICAFTDRPLYRPGDAVRVKFVGREFKDARRSVPLKASPLSLTVNDPNGTPVVTRRLKISPETGADTDFILPENSIPGGYDLSFDFEGNSYGASFRVAEYVKPHYEIHLVLSKPEFKTGEAITGQILLRYPDGKPVGGAALQMTVKSQQLTMVESELRYSGQFPVKLETEDLAVDQDGAAAFTLPPATHPSRYIVTLFANDEAAYRVKTTKEILIERGATLYTLSAPRHFTAPGEAVTLSFQAQGRGGTAPSRWEIVRLESQERTTGRLDPGSRGWTVSLDRAGSYTLMLRDDGGNLLASTGHWVSGEGLKATPGSIEIVFDKEKYRPGETAQALITFPEPVEEGLLTLERDRVDRHALLSAGANWLRIRRIGTAQWQAEIPVKTEYAPNMTFSVLYSLRGDYVFQNRGIQVEQEAIALQFKADKEVYRPGDRVTVEVRSTIGGKGAPANITVSVVDEMVYVLQPEIAPDLLQFFYHPRRNNVRTSASLSFITYDMALSALPAPPPRSNTNERGIKVLERPRRDNIDTAAWIPNLKTDASGKATFTFTMPDALTRWRITGRAMTGGGIVGQRTAWINSFKPLYLTWTGPARFRQGDGPLVDVAAFNQTGKPADVDLVASGSGLNLSRKLLLKPGTNYIVLPMTEAREGAVTLQLKQGGKVVDALSTPIRVDPVQWSSPRSEVLPVSRSRTPLKLPADAGKVRVAFGTGTLAQFSRIVDDLIEYPWGCVEQTASRMIPLSLAYQAMGEGAGKISERIALTLQTNRLRLIHMAGPDAAFGWWGNMTEKSALWTAYAYYADWYATRTLRIALPPEHWARVLEAYKKNANHEPLLHRALALWFASEMGLPIKTMLDGLQDEVPGIGALQATRRRIGTSPLLAEPTFSLGQQIAVVLIAHMASQQNQNLKPGVAALLPPARDGLRSSGLPLSEALLLLEGGPGSGKQAEKILSRVRQEMPTFDRALTLVWVQKAMGALPSDKPVNVKLQGDWRPSASQTGNTVWQFAGKGKRPTTLDLAETPAGPLFAIVRYESSTEEMSLLPVGIERRLYRLKAGAKILEFDTEPVDSPAGSDEQVSSKDLYLEEITLSPRENGTIRYGVLEVPLPPGAAVERTTWGMRISGLGKPGLYAMERARHEMGQLSYSVPVDTLNRPITFRHLVRFSQKGKFRLPQARFFRMYQPEEKAFEGDGKAPRLVEIQ